MADLIVHTPKYTLRLVSGADHADGRTAMDAARRIVAHALEKHRTDGHLFITIADASDFTLEVDGSGTTAAVAKRLGRSSVSIDVRESQCELMQRRVDEVLITNHPAARADEGGADGD